MKSLFLLPFLFLGFFASAQNFEPLQADNHSLFLADENLDDFIGKKVVPIAFDSIVNGVDQTQFFPYRTLKTFYGWYRAKSPSWLGKEILVDKSSGTFIIRNDFVQFDNKDNQLIHLGEGSFTFHYDKPIGFEWTPDDDGKIVAEVTAIESFDYEGEPDLQKIIRLTSTSNDYEWTTGEIRISENHGIISMPDMQFFPFEWRNCNFISTNTTTSGFKDPSNFEMFHMNPGDKYTVRTNTFNYFGEKPKDTYLKYQCLHINSLNGNAVDRDMLVTTIQFDTNIGKWEVKEDTINQVLDYDTFEQSERSIQGTADQFFKFTDYHPFGNYKHVVLSETGLKYNIYLNEQDDLFSPVVDGCDNYYAFASGFDIYSWCQYLAGEGYYLPVYIKAGDHEWGQDINVDSLLSVQPIDWSKNITISPNPNDGVFSLDLSDHVDLKTIVAKDMLGRSQVVVRQGSQMRIEGGQGLYVLVGMTEAGQLVILGKVLKL